MLKFKISLFRERFSRCDLEVDKSLESLLQKEKKIFFSEILDLKVAKAQQSTSNHDAEKVISIANEVNVLNYSGRNFFFLTD